MSSMVRVDALATEIANAFEYDKTLGSDVARSNLITFYNHAIEEAAKAAENVLPASDRILARTVIRTLLIAE